MDDALRHDVLDRARWGVERETHAALLADPAVARLRENVRACCGGHAARRHFLSDAVRVDATLLPGLHDAFASVRTRLGLDLRMEAFVYADPSINGAVLRTPDRTIVTLSSGAVERLVPRELDFIIGHELGHASYGHLDLPVAAILQTQRIDEALAMRLLAWQREAEISADRAGLAICGSLEIAASALFKTLSGLRLDGATVDPRGFAAQWSELADEVVREARRDHWRATHPFPALRMQAMVEFWESDACAGIVAECDGGRAGAAADDEIRRMLAMMDPRAGAGAGDADPILGPFLLWGGLYVAAHGGRRCAEELDRLRTLVGRNEVDRALAEGALEPEACRRRFLGLRRERRAPLSALELHRIFSGLASLATSDGTVGAAEMAALLELAASCGVSPVFVENVLREAA